MWSFFVFGFLCAPLSADADCGDYFQYLVVRESSLENAVVENLRLAPSFRYLPGFAGQWSLSLEQAKYLHEMAQTSKEPDSYGVQRDVIDKVMDWIQANPTADFDKAFGVGPGKIGLNREQLDNAFFNSPMTVRMALQQEAIRRKVPFSPLAFRRPGGIPDDERAMVRRMAAQQVVEWIKANPGKPLELKNFGQGPGKVGLSQDQLYATGHYRSEGVRHASRYFDSMADALVTVKKIANAEGIAFNLIDFNWRGGIPAEILPMVQQEASQRAVDWLRNNPGKRLSKWTYGVAPGQVGIGQDQMNGTGEYRPTKSRHASRYFDSMELALLNVKKLAVEQKVPFRLIDYDFESGITDIVRPEIQKEAVDYIVDWLKNHPGEKLVDSNFGSKGSDKIAITSNRFYGQGDYGPGNPLEASHIFPNRVAAVLAIQAAAAERNVPFRVIDLNWVGGFPPSLRPSVEKEVLGAIVDWVRHNEGKKLVRSSFGNAPDKINLDETRVFGTASYRPGSPDRESRFFDDRKTAKAAIVRALQNTGLHVPPNF